MFDRLFLAHPRSIEESYLEHQKTAFGFAAALLLAAAACALHGLFPAVCEKTGSGMVKRLYERMVMHRRKAASQTPAPGFDYAI